MSTELASPDTKYTLDQWVQSDKFKRNLEALLHTPQAVERFVQIALGALKRNSKLKDCWQPSIFDCLLKLNQIGLEPDGYHAHLIPFRNNKTDRLEAQLIIDYKGLVTVMRRNPEITVVKGAVVYAMDGFLYREGSDRVFEHKPSFAEPGERNPILGAYSFVKFRSGDWEVDFLPTWKIERARAASRAKDSGPWIDHYDEMAVKTAHRHHSKVLPLKPEERLAMAVDDDQFEYEPFEPRPKLPQRAPEFIPDETAKTTEPDRTQEPAGGDGREPDAPRRRGRPPGAGRKSDSPATGTSSESTSDQSTATDTIPTGENVGNESAGQTKEEKEYKYGPGDDGPIGSFGGPVSKTPASAKTAATAEGKLRDDREPNKTAVDNGNASDGILPKLSKKGEEVVALIQKHQVKFEEVLQVLKKHDIELGDAEEKGVIGLPENTLALCVKQWGTILFNIKNAKAQAEQPDGTKS